MTYRERNAAMVNGALIGLGLLAIVDNVGAHWILRLHRAVPGPWAVQVEAVLVALGAVMVALGAWRERGARSRASARHSGAGLQ